MGNRAWSACAGPLGTTQEDIRFAIHSAATAVVISSESSRVRGSGVDVIVQLVKLPPCQSISNSHVCTAMDDVSVIWLSPQDANRAVHKQADIKHEDAYHIV